MKTSVHNLIIVDASGSMTPIYDQALKGINETLSNIKQIAEENRDIKQYVTLLSFANGGERLQYIYNGKNICQTHVITPAEYQLRGLTALYDAIGISVSKMKAQINEKDKVLVTIITDGYENDSREWDETMVRKLIEQLMTQGWVFAYIGANQDAEIEAGKIGVINSMNWEASIEGTGAMFEREKRSRQNWNRRVSNGETELECGYFEQEVGSAPLSRTTPKHIEHLGHNEIIVFGSNINGFHSGGLALKAVKKYGALFGIGEGMQGQSYAIPTTDCSSRDTAEAIGRFIVFAKQHPNLQFYVTSIGCGHAGYKPYEMARLFVDAVSAENIYLPAEFWRYLV